MKFLRRTSKKISKLGRKRKKKQVWKRPSGRDNKMRERRRGYPAIVSIGYRENKKERGKIKGFEPIMVYNLEDLKNIKKEQIAVIGNVGLKKKVELLKKIKEMKIKVSNLNEKKVLKNIKKSGDKNESK